MSIPESALYAIEDRASLLDFLRTHLNWPVALHDTFLYAQPELQGDAVTCAQISQIVPFTADAPFTIMLVEFATAFRRSHLREILRRMHREIRKRANHGGRNLEEIVFVCVTEGYGGFRFARYEEQAGCQPKMSVFGWERSQVGGVRRLLEYNLSALKMPPAGWALARWMEAWDIEKVTHEFLREYRATFEAIEQLIADANATTDKPEYAPTPDTHAPESLTGNPIPASGKPDWRLFTQRLFNRLMFIQFLTRRGSLHFEGSTDCLPGLFALSSGADEKFYHDLRYWGFFAASDAGEVEAGMQAPPGLRELRGAAAYLDGALFAGSNDGAEPVASLDGRRAVQIPHAVFERILHGLFARWNFTVFESTPLDVEVAVDPEMLGKVFEELVTGRHESGSYYTPRGIVAFMCREALKHYLTAAGIPAEAAATFVDDRSTTALREQDFETTLAALKRVRVVNPACGSGAYLLGMLHELVELRRLLFNSNHKNSNRKTPEHKTPEHKDDPRDDYGRKLDIIQHNLYGVDLDEFAVNIARLRLWLSLAVEDEGLTSEPLPNLDFKIERGDSLMDLHPQSGDFDIVLANPPYLSTKRRFGQENRALLRKNYHTARGQFDAYALFLERALSLLCSTGCYAYLVPRPVLTNSSTLPVRQLLNIDNVIAIADPGSVFTASVEPVIIVGRKNSNSHNGIRIFSAEYFLDARNGPRCAKAADICTPVGTWNIAMPTSAERLIVWSASFPRFGDLFDVKRGVECGKKNLAVLHHTTADTRRLLRGEDMERYTIRFANQHIVRGNANRTFKPEALYDAPKLIIRRVANRLIAAVDLQGYHVLNTIYVARARPANTLSLEYVCAVLNSPVMNDYFQALYMNNDRLFPYIRKAQLDQLPIALPSAQEEAEIVSLVRQLPDAFLEQSAQIQAEIALRVQQLYSNTP